MDADSLAIRNPALRDAVSAAVQCALGADESALALPRLYLACTDAGLREPFAAVVKRLRIVGLCPPAPAGVVDVAAKEEQGGEEVVDAQVDAGKFIAALAPAGDTDEVRRKWLHDWCGVGLWLTRFPCRMPPC
jgi:hypothetical protein